MTLNGNILVIDDDQNLRTTLSLILTRASYSVATASNADQALHLIRDHHFDLVFLDKRMPEMDGLDLLPQIVQMRPDLPVVFLTVEASLDTAIRAMNLGAVGYLLKPIDPEQILNRISGILEEKKNHHRRNKIVREIHDIMGDISQK